MSQKNLHIETLQLHGGIKTPDAAQACASPLHQTAAYRFNDCYEAAETFALRQAGNIYGRLTNPTQALLESRVAALEGAPAAVATASGAAAVSATLFNLALPGDHIIAADNLYGGTYNFIVNTLAQYGVEYTIVNVNNAAEVEAAIRTNTKAVFAETFGNPNSDVTDLDTLSSIAHKHGFPVVVDNTFGTPALIRPIEHGVDIVVHSATKFLGGHGTSLGGIVVDCGTFDWKAYPDKYPTLCHPDPNYHGTIFADAAPDAPFATRVRAVMLRDLGACISPFNAFLILQGIETLSLRIERHVANALKVVEFLSKNPHVTKVNHPSLPTHHDHTLYTKLFPNGAGSIFTIELEGGRENAWKFINSLKLFSLVANVGDMKSLAIHPASTTHSQLSDEELEHAHISQSTVRLSIGCENIEDILNDLGEALNAVYNQD